MRMSLTVKQPMKQANRSETWTFTLEDGGFSLGVFLCRNELNFCFMLKL